MSKYKAGYVSVMGRPNVGKSTLINAFLKQKITAVSPRPQTTRKRQLGILTYEDAQVIFIDTPGIHHPKHKLGEKMNRASEETLDECDLILFVVDVSQNPQPEDYLLNDLLNKLKHRPPVILVMNKADLVNEEKLSTHRAEFLQITEVHRDFTISATSGENLPDLLATILSIIPVHAPYFPEEQITDLYERELAADLIREAALYLLRDEVPHGIAIRIDQFLERSEMTAYIEATLFVERESHKGIVIGQDGQMLKKIGILAREKIESMSGRKVFLQLRVKVRKNWRDDDRVLGWFGY
jgi:GTPase